MTSSLSRASIAILASLAVAASAGSASAYTARVKSACKGDFYRFCPGYKVGSSQLRACMRSAGGNVSTRCVDALADSGEIPRKYHSKNRG